MENKKIIDIKNLSFVYKRSEEDTFLAIDDFSLEIEK